MQPCENCTCGLEKEKTGASTGVTVTIVFLVIVAIMAVLYKFSPERNPKNADATPTANTAVNEAR